MSISHGDNMGIFQRSIGIGPLRQTDRQTDRQIGRQADREACRVHCRGHSVNTFPENEKY